MSSKPTVTAEILAKFEAVANNHGIETLKERNIDSLDFPEVFVGDIVEMMEYAYALGRSEK